MKDKVVVGFLDDGHWSAVFGLCYRDLLLRDQATSQRIVRQGGAELRQLCGTGGLVAGRNRVAADFLDRTDGDWLWMIDTDMGFGADTVDRLIAAAHKDIRPVVGGLAFKLTRERERGEFYAERYRVQPTLYRYLEIEDEVGFLPFDDYPRDELVPVSATGAACLLVHRRALAKVRKVYGDAWFDPITHPTGDKGKARTFSEDLSFCVRLAAVDVAIHVHTGVRTCHEKGGVFLDEHLFDTSRVRVDQAAPLVPQP